MIYIILGMHKSGTTLISKTLHESGINMLDGTENYGTYDSGNTMERQSTKLINHNLLSSKYKSSLNIYNVSSLNISKNINTSINILIKKLNSSNLNWGFKDPKTCLTYKVWKKYLPAHKLIIIHRHPKEVWKHYWSLSIITKIKCFVNFFKVWVSFNNAILEILNETIVPAKVIEYNKFMTSYKTFRELEVFVGFPLTNIKDINLYRNKRDANILYKFALFFHKLFGGTDPYLVRAKLMKLSKKIT